MTWATWRLPTRWWNSQRITALLEKTSLRAWTMPPGLWAASGSNGLQRSETAPMNTIRSSRVRTRLPR